MSNRKSILVIGAGSIGERHLRCFQQTERASLAFVEINDSLRTAIGERYGVVGFAKLDEALDTSPDAAVIATPAHLHIPLALKVAERGIHLLIEKPLSTTMDDIEPLAGVAKRQNLMIAVAYVYRCFPALAAMRDAVISGRFGNPVEIVAVSGQHFPTYRPAYRSTYYTDHETGGGAIQDALTHVINAGEWMVGPIDRLVADARHQVLGGVEVEDTVHLLARHGTVLGSYSLNQHQAPNESTITVVCERGTARWEAHTQRWRWVAMPDTPWNDEPQSPLPRDAAFLAQAHRFLDAMEGKAPPLCTLEDGVQTLRVNLAALESARRGSWQTIASETPS